MTEPKELADRIEWQKKHYSSIILTSAEASIVLDLLRFPSHEALIEENKRLREASQAVVDFMRVDVDSGDSLLWTPDYEELYDKARAALAKQGETG